MSKEVIRVDFENKNAVLKCSDKILRIVREKFSVKNPVFIKRKFDPRRYAITPSGAFQIGIWEEIEGFIRTLPIAYEVQLSPAFRAVYEPSIRYKEIQTIDGFTYYDYQKETIRLFLENGRGIALLATAAGKTLVAAGFCKTLLAEKPDAKILISVPNIGLLNQTYKSFVEEFGLKYEQVTTWGDKKLPNLKANILLANNQILLSDVKASVDLLKDFDYVIVDEVHTLGDRTNKINKVIHNIKTPNKFGLSGTLPNDMFACWNILGKIGPILIEESSFSVRQKGTASNVKIMIVYCRHKKIPIVIPTTHNDQPTWEYENECTYIYTHKDRNDLIMELADKAEGNSLILVDKRLHGDALNKYKTKKELYYINGDMPVEERVKITDRMEKQNNIICIAMTQIFSVGISIKNLNNLIFCAIGKSNVRICQSIGRSMRLHENKELAKIFDIADNSKYSRDHLLLRVQIYKEEKIDYKIKTKDLWK